MHAALHNHDILHTIFTYVADEDNSSTCHGEVSLRSNARSLASCARTCKSFHQPALSVLWRSVTLGKTAPLFTVFSSFQLVGIRKRYLCGDILDEEWARFQAYANHVLRLDIDYNSSDTVDSQVLFYLVRKNEQSPLLPRLQHLTWKISLSFDTNGLAFISPSLRSLDLDCDYSAQREGMALLVRSACRGAPNLHEIRLAGFHDASLMLVAIGASRHLRKVTIARVRESGTIFPLLQALSKLESLADLTITGSWNISDDMPQCAGFYALEKLFFCGSAPCMMSLVMAVSPPLLRSLTLAIQKVQTLADYGASLAAACANFVLLHAVRVWIATLASHSAIQARDGDLIVRPLLDLQDLESVRIELGHSIPPFFSNEMIHEMAAAWPKLHSLKLTSNAGQTQLTLDTDVFVVLARKCPRLHTLLLPSMEVPSSRLLDACPVLSHNLRSLRFSNVTWKDSALLAQFVDRLFPNLDITDDLARLGRTAGCERELYSFLEMFHNARRQQMARVGLRSEQ